MAPMELFHAEAGRKTWQLRFTDHAGCRRRLSLRTAVRATALDIKDRIDRLIGIRAGNGRIPPELVQWIHAAHKEIRTKLEEWGIAETSLVRGGQKISELIDLWEQSLAAEENTTRYTQQTAQRVRVLMKLEAPGSRPIDFFADITAEAVDARIKVLRRLGPPVPEKTKRQRRPAGPQTCNFYLEKAQQFCAWVVGKGWAMHNPIAGLAGYRQGVVQENRQRKRRALTIEEQAALLTTTASEPARWGFTGKQRALLYRVALRTGLRAAECRSLTRASFNLFARTVTVLAADAKARREDTLPLHAELIEPLREQLEGKLPAASAFPDLHEDTYVEMLRDDLAAAGIAYKDPLGYYADFHALRHSYGTELAKVVMPAVHQRLMRHRDIATTMKFYTHLQHQDADAGLAKLPAIATPSAAQNEQAGA